MSFKHIIPETKNQLKRPVLPVPQVKTEASMAIKNEPLDSEMIEIGVDDILDSSDIPDKKDIDIVYNSLCEDSIKSETVPENTFERKHWESVETQVSIQENISQNETLIKSKDISDGNENRGTGQGAIGIQGSIDQFNSVETNKQFLNHSKDLNGISARSRKTKHSKTTPSWGKDKAPLIRHSCDQCDFTTYIPSRLNVHKLIHLKPEEIEYFYCCHCVFKSRYIDSVKTHMLERHYNIVGIKQKSSEMIEIGVDDILDSSDIPDKKDIDIVYNSLCEDSIKTETVPENTFERKHWESVETQVSIQTENTPFIKTENISQNETLIKSKDISDGNENRGTGQGAIEFQDSIDQFNSVETNKQFLNHSKDLNGISARSRKAKHSKTTPSWRKDKAPLTRFSCDRCDFKTRYYADLKNHNLIHLKPEDTQYFYCSHCSFKTKHKYNLSSHQASKGHCKNVEIEQKQKRFRCDHCDYKTRYSSDLKKHNIIHLKPEEGQYFYCDYCSYKSRHKPHVQRHIFTLHKKNVGSKQKRFSCDRCDFKTRSYATLKNHNLIHLKPEDTKKKQKRFRCDHCDYKTYFRATLRVHNLIHLKPEESQYFYCYHCSFKSKYKSSLQTHIFGRHFKNVKIEQKENRFRCDHCDYETHRRDHLKRHNLIHLNPEEVQYFYCSHCSFKSKYKSYLRTHILRHFQNEEVKFCCYICDFMTLERELIIYHIRKHSKVRNKSKINEGN